MTYLFVFADEHTEVHELPDGDPPSRWNLMSNPIVEAPTKVDLHSVDPFGALVPVFHRFRGVIYDVCGERIVEYHEH